MNFRQLKQFLAVVEHNGFTAAAEHLHTAQPAVSRSVRLLEEELGVMLLDRGRSSLTLTAEGRAFAKHARAILTEADASRTEIAAIRNLEAGHVSLGVPPMVAAHVLPVPLSDFLTEWPGLTLSVVQAGAEEVREGVAQGRFDLGVVADWRPFEGLVTVRLERHPMVACVAATSTLANHRQITWKKLLSQPLITFPHSYYLRTRLEDVAKQLGIATRVVAEAEAIPMILEFVRRGNGVATLPEAAVYRQDGVAALRLPADENIQIALCHRDNSPISTAAQALRDFLVGRFAPSATDNSTGAGA